MKNTSSIQIDKEALLEAEEKMKALYERNLIFYGTLKEMFSGIATALQSPAGEAIEITGEEVLLEPIQRMSLILKHTCDTLSSIIEGGEDTDNSTYGPLFRKYSELCELINTKAVSK